MFVYGEPDIITVDELIDIKCTQTNSTRYYLQSLVYLCMFRLNKLYLCNPLGKKTYYQVINNEYLNRLRKYIIDFMAKRNEQI